MAASLADYRAALRAPGAVGPLLASALGRFPIAMLGLGTLFYVQRGYGSFAAAGFVAAAMLTGEATGSVAQGRIVDRFGPTLPLLVAAGFLVGLTAPALPGASRALWSRLVPPGPRREAAYTYEAVSLEVFFILGPAAAAALITARWAGTGLTVAMAAMLVGAMWFALTRTVRGHRPARSAEITHSSVWGAMASPGMRVVGLASLGFGCVVGVVEVGVPAVTTQAGRPALAGVLLSAWSVASVLAGLVYGLRPWPRPLHHRLPVLLAVFALSVAAMAVLPGLLGLAVAMVVAGCVITPQVTAHSLAVEVAAPAGTATEAFGWVITAATLGLAAGQAMGGALVEAFGPPTAFLTGAGAGLVLAAAMWLLRGSLAPSAPETVSAPAGSPAGP